MEKKRHGCFKLQRSRWIDLRSLLCVITRFKVCIALWWLVCAANRKNLHGVYMVLAWNTYYLERVMRNQLSACLNLLLYYFLNLLFLAFILCQFHTYT